MTRTLIILAALVMLTGCATQQLPQAYHVSYQCMGNEEITGDTVLITSGHVKSLVGMLNIKRAIEEQVVGPDHPDEILSDTVVNSLTHLGPVE